MIFFTQRPMTPATPQVSPVTEMTVLHRTLYPAFVAGAAAGVLLFILQRWTTGPVIHQAESYEQVGVPAHQPDHAGEPSDDPLVRAAYTITGDVLLGIGFGMLLAAIYALGGKAGSLPGIVWGMAGFATFHLGPALIVPPSIPALELAPLGIRQVGWLLAAFCTALGLALLTFGQRAAKFSGLLVLALPYVLSRWFFAVSGGTTVSPPLAALQRHFVMYVLGDFLLFWIALGTLSGYLFEQSHDAKDEASLA